MQKVCQEEIFAYLVEHRMIEDYDTWYCHGESLHATGVTTNLNMNQTINNDDLNDDDDNDDDVMDMFCNIFRAPSRNNNVNLDEDERVEANLG